MDYLPLVPDNRAYQALAVNKLAMANPWPVTMPDVPEDPNGLFRPSNASMLGKILRENQIEVILELGSWTGVGSTRYFLEHENFTGIVICSDIWSAGWAELVNPHLDPRIPILYETFCRNNWKYRDRVIPLLYDTLVGLELVSKSGVIPDLIYVDADHRYEHVMAQLEAIRRFFPSSIVTGDDWKAWPGVKKAVIEFTRTYNLGFEVIEEVWLLKWK